MAYTIRRKRTLNDFLILPGLFTGLKVTIKHFFKNLNDIHQIKTLEYPEALPDDLSPRYRGQHRLTQRDDGSIRCVACFMCATACPAQCIFIEAKAREDNIDEKEPHRFDIDLLECIFCGYCVEACPCDAIRMDSDIFTMVAQSRKDFILTKSQLLATKGAYEPTQSAAQRRSHE